MHNMEIAMKRKVKPARVNKQFSRPAPSLGTPFRVKDEVRTLTIDELAPLITGRLAQLEGIRRTHTMVAFEVFSEHDLEALFSIGD